MQNVQSNVLPVKKDVAEMLYGMKVARYLDKSITSYNLNRRHSISFLKLYINSRTSQQNHFYLKTITCFQTKLMYVSTSQVTHLARMCKCLWWVLKIIVFVNRSRPYKLYKLIFYYCIKIHLTRALITYNAKYFLIICVILLKWYNYLL